MITSDLIAYIKSQLDENISKDLIISNLTQVGWRIEDINEGLAEVESSLPKIEVVESFPKEEVKQEIKVELKPAENKSFDVYREFPDGIDIEKENPYQIITPEEVKPIAQEIKSEVVGPVAPLVETEIKSEVKIEPEAKIKTIISEVKLEPKIEINPEPVKVWIPKSIVPKESVIEPVVENEIENYNLELEAGEVTPSTVVSAVKVEPEAPAKPEVQEDLIPIINKNRFESVNFPKTEPVVKENLSQEIKTVTIAPVRNISSFTNSTSPVSVMKDIVPKSAMISSYSQDILAANQEKEGPKNQKNKFIKIGVIFIILAIIGSMAFAFVEGYIKIPWLNWKYSIVKKDPKAFLLGASDSIASLSSYKVETSVDISTPSLSSITTGLANGEAVNSINDRDSMSINTKGFANHVDGKLNFQYLVNITSSMLKNDITSDLKYDGKNIYASIPDLKEILKNDAPKKNNVSFTPDQLGSVIDQFSPSMQEIVKKIDGYNISSGQIPLYIKTKTKSIFEEFVNSLTYVEKGKENIHDVETYHYELTVDRQSTKKLLVSLSDLFITSATDEQKKELDEMLGASSISSFDVWIGVEDNNLYQIEFKLVTPLSKVLGLNDSGIAGNEVQIDWKTTYYDLNVPNKILIPTYSINMDTFINEIKDTKIKNIISTFKPEANALRNAIGSYGTRTNPTGSCANPNPGSLFSPLGHRKGSETAVGNIAQSLNSLMSVSNGAGSCYSTPKEWSLSVPLYTLSVEETPKFFCADSLGNSLSIDVPIKGTSCK